MLDLRPLKVVVTGGTGFVGRHLTAALESRGCENITVWGSGHDRHQSLIRDSNVYEAIDGADVVFHLAALCGGIGANQSGPADFIYNNMMMGLNVIKQSEECGVSKLVMVGTLCAYPKDTLGPIEPEDLWNGYPEPTNAPYGIAKRTLVEVGKAFHKQHGLNVVNVMPTNMFGPGDNFKPESSHVIPALIRRVVEAKRVDATSVTCWGTGTPTRDFLYVTDAVEGIIRAAERLDDPEPVLLGTGSGTTMRKLAEMISELVGYRGRIVWDASKPDGQPNRVVSTRSQIEWMDFMPQISLDTGLEEMVRWYCNMAK